MSDYHYDRAESRYDSRAYDRDDRRTDRDYDRKSDRRYEDDRHYDSDEDRDRPRRKKTTRTREKERGEPDYMEETTYVERGKGPPPRDLIHRSRDKEDDSVEDIPREFPPPSRSVGGYRDDRDDYDAPPRRSRSAYGRRDEYDDDDDDYYDRRPRKDRRRRDRSRDSYYSEDDRHSERRRGSRSPNKERRKSGVEDMLEGLGLGGAAGGIAKKFLGGGDKDKDRSRSRSRRGDRSSSREKSQGKGGKKERQWAQAAQAAIVAGAVEAFRARNEPGPWTGTKGRRIATAAIGAGGIDRIADRNPDKKSKVHLAEAVIGGLAANRLANGPRDKGGRDDSRGRSRSRSRSIMDRFRSKSRGRSITPDDRSPRREQSKGRGLAGLATGGALAAAGKAIYDRVRSKSRGAKDRRRDDSEDSYGRSRSRRRDVGNPSQRSRSMGPDDGAVVGPRGAGLAAGEGGRGRRGSSSSSSSSEESENEIEEKRKKMKGKELLTAGLASIATIHAAHGVYQSMNASERRHKLVAEGEMSPEEAKKKRSKAWLQDAAAVGIAALGIKGAYSEWKEMNEQRHGVRELEERRKARAKRNEKRMRDARMRGQPSRPGAIQGPGGYSGAPLPPPESDGYHRDPSPYAEQMPPPPMGASNGDYR